MNIRDCFSRVRVYTNNGIKKDIPNGNKTLELSKLAGNTILLLIYRGITRYTGVIVTFEPVDFTIVSNTAGSTYELLLKTLFGRPFSVGPQEDTKQHLVILNPSQFE